MGRLERSHRGALDRLREKNRREKEASEDEVYEAEKTRLEAWLQAQRDRKATEEALQEQMDYFEAQKGNWGPNPRNRPATHIFDISTAYIGHDTNYGTQRLSPFLLNEWATDLGYLEPDMREELCGKSGYVSRGFPVEGPVPLYGAWENAKKLTAAEKKRLHETQQELQHRLAAVGQLMKLRQVPYEFEDKQILEGCWNSVSKLLSGPWADPVSEEEIKGKEEWIFPYFGIGQKWSDELNCWAKIRPIANEKRRNLLCSPISEHMSLPGTDVVVDMILYAHNPTIGDSMTQTKKDITESITRNRKKKGGGKMVWTDVTTLPSPLPGYTDHSFTPVFGKLDLFQACLQMGVARPERNLFQIFSPDEQKYVYGKSFALSFGNIHSVFGFVASVSELVSRVINELMEIPVAVYIDDITFMATPRLQELYMSSIREMLAIAGIAVAPEKCEGKIAKEFRASFDFDSLYEELEQVSGLFIHATYWRNVKRGVPLARFIYDLLAFKGNFCDRICSQGCLRSLKLLLAGMIEEVQLQKRMVLRRSVAIRKRLHVMTDASASESDNRVAFGGLLFREDGSSVGFSLHTTQAELPPNLRRASILVYELIAIRVAQLVFAEDYAAASVVQHCDNAAAVYGLAKGSLKCSLATSIVMDIGNTNMDREDLTFYAYINTHANPSDACTRTDMLNALAKAYHTQFTISPQTVREIIEEIASESEVCELNGWKTLEQLEAEATKKGKPKKTGNKYSGTLPQFKLEIQEALEEDPRRPKAENIVPRAVSNRWPLSEAQTIFVWPEESVHLGTEKGLPIRNSKWRVWMLYTITYLKEALFDPNSVKTKSDYDTLREHHPNVLWAQLQIFGQWLYEKETQQPKSYVALVAQRLRSLNCLEKHSPQANHLQTLTFKALETYGERFEPCRAMPPDVEKSHRLDSRQQLLFAVWMSTGLRKESMASLRPDLMQIVTPQNKFMHAIVPSVKSVPVPGETFSVYFPAKLYREGLFPVEAHELDKIAQLLGTTSHGMRRALAIYLRRRAAEVNALPGTKEYQIFKRRVCEHFAWTQNSLMWEDIYSLDVIKYVNAKFYVHPDVDAWFTTELY
eukprot:g1211.t1